MDEWLKYHTYYFQLLSFQKSIHQTSYVGNVAWGHICAMRSLRDHPETCGGNPYFLTDNTPLVTFQELCEPYVRARGYKYGRPIPFKVGYFIVYLISLVLSLIRPFKKINIPVTMKMLEYINVSYTYKPDKAARDLDYKPIFTYEESVQLSMPYYKEFK